MSQRRFKMLAFTGPAVAMRVVLRQSTFGAQPLTISRIITPSQYADICTSPTAVAKNEHKSRPKSGRRMPAIIRPVVPSQKLLEFRLGLEDKAQARNTVVKIMNTYIKEHNLQNPQNKRIVHCDETLKSVLGVDQCNILQIAKYVSPHLLNPDDLGGRYLEEAKQVEQEYFEKKDAEKALREQESPHDPSDSPRSRRRASSKPRVFKEVVLSEDLAKVCNAKLLTRPQVLKAVWNYIRENGLQGGSGKPVTCDAQLKKVFGVTEIDVKGVMKGISPHLTAQKTNS